MVVIAVLMVGEEEGGEKGKEEREKIKENQGNGENGGG